MQTLIFNRVRDIKDLALYFQSTPDVINKIISEKDSYSSICLIPKKNGAKRTVIEITSFDWSRFLKQLHFSIQKQYTFQDCIEGFLKNKSIKTNAQKHLNKKYLLNLDIKDFYFSINYLEIVNSFKKLGSNDTVSEILSQICTYNNQLYPGLNTSPLISNIVFESLDSRLSLLCQENGMQYTRYADDLSFSSDDPIYCLPIIEKYLLEKNFKINKHKLKFSKRGQSQYVTGLSISDKNMPRLPRKFKRNLRLLLHYAEMNGIEKYHQNPNSRNIMTIFGQLMYSSGIEPYFASKYFKKMQNLKI